MKKIFFLGLIAACLLYSSAPAVYAWGDSISRSDTTDGMDAVLTDLGVQKEELTKTISEVNYSDYKKQQPQVSLTFTPQNPVTGEEVTATAIPTYFMNDVKVMYFTWYLKSSNCDETDSPNQEERTRCDLNNDGKININDYKIKAARIIASDDFNWEKDGAYSENTDSDSYTAVFGGDDQRGKNTSCVVDGETKNTCYIHNIATGVETDIPCDNHLFPNAPGHRTGNYNTPFDNPNTDYSQDGFDTDEEKFWRTDPAVNDTAGLGNKDEANVAGMGAQNFTWTYEEGDQIGVVVEGASVQSTSCKDSSFKTMWALLKNKCDTENIQKASDINNCLTDNLIDPATSGTEKLSVELSYSPENPINDPNDSNNGDQIIIQSSIYNAKDPAYLKYSWQVFQSDDPNPDSWGNPLLKSELPESTQTTGIGLDSFKFKLNLPNPKNYLKVRLDVIENLGENSTREGHSDVVMPISSASDQIKVFGVSADANLQLSLKESAICEEGAAKAICPVSKNEIIGLSIPKTGLADFMWTIDGKPFTYSECFFDGCDENAQTNTAFFPILKNKGERYTVGLAATNVDTGKKVDLTRVFEVADPQIAISSADETVCKPELLGNYLDLDGKEWPDYSKLNFWALSDYPIKLKALSNSASISTENLNWSIDNNVITKDNAAAYGYSIDDSGVLTLTAKSEGEYYDVTAGALYAQSNLVKKALNKYWGVSYDQFYEKVISDSITIQMKNFAPLAQGTTGKKILANLYSSLPSYLAFLFRIVLTAFVILITSSLVLSLSPNINTKNEY